ncbi:MAG: glycosyltransferase [Desulfobacteraceae bacterium]|nr:glycosyltransferase [Desulfobacteraceae bacterium]
MRIFQVLHPSTNRSIKNSMTWYRNLYEPLLDLGIEVFLLRLDEVERKIGAPFRSPEYRDKLSQYLLDSFQREHDKKPFDLFFSYLHDSDVHPACIKQIGRSGAITANFSCNNIHQFDLTEKIAPHYHYNLHSEKLAAEKFRAIGATPQWFQMAANPKYYYPTHTPRVMDAVFIGAFYAKRPHYIYNLLENGVDIQVFGPNWKENDATTSRERFWKVVRKGKKLCQYAIQKHPGKRAALSSEIAQLDFRSKMNFYYGPHLHPPVEDELMVQRYNEAKVVLGFIEVFDGHDPSGKVLQHLHLREFEVPMCGALYITNYSEELSEFYEPDREILVFRNEQELVDKTRFYLKNESIAEDIRAAGYKRALANHTYQKRFQQLFKELGLNF